MSISMPPATNVTCWLACLARTKQRLDTVLDVMGEGEADWAPDDGIATAREHLWAIAESERSLTAILTRGTMTNCGYQAQHVDFEEIKRTLEICNRNLVGWLEDLEDREIDPQMIDALLAHLDLKAHHTAFIASLTQLIDPSRLSSSSIV